MPTKKPTPLEILQAQDAREAEAGYRAGNAPSPGTRCQGGPYDTRKHRYTCENEATLYMQPWSTAVPGDGITPDVRAAAGGSQILSSVMGYNLGETTPQKIPVCITHLKGPEQERVDPGFVPWQSLQGDVLTAEAYSSDGSSGMYHVTDEAGNVANMSGTEIAEWNERNRLMESGRVITIPALNREDIWS